MTAFVSEAWPWYIAGPIIGLFVPALLITGNRAFGVSSTLRHLGSAVLPGKISYFRYEWKRIGLWNLVFVAGILVGGFLASHWAGSQQVAISEQTRLALGKLGIHDFSGLAPHEVFSWPALLTLKGFVSVVVGGFLGLRGCLRRRLHFRPRHLRPRGPATAFIGRRTGFLRGRSDGNAFFLPLFFS